MGCCSNDADGNPQSVDARVEEDRCVDSWHLNVSRAAVWSCTFVCSSFKVPEIDLVLVSLPSTEVGSAVRRPRDAYTYEIVLPQAQTQAHTFALPTRALPANSYARCSLSYREKSQQNIH
jgi:hypothetical protein